MRNSEFILALGLFIFSTHPALAQEEDERAKGRGFDAVQLVLDGQNLYVSCRELAGLHLDALRKVPSYRASDPSKAAEVEARYARALEQEELAFLSRESWSISSLKDGINGFEQHALNAPASQLRKIPLGELSTLCRLAIEPQGKAGLTSLPAALKDCADAIGKLDELASQALKKVEAKQTGQSSTAGEISDDEEAFRLKRQRWEANQREKELQAIENEKLYAQRLQQQQATQTITPPADAKVGYRKDLPPSPPPPPKPTIKPEMAAAMRGWYPSYWNQIKPFKLKLAQVVALKGPKVAYARRDACGLLYSSIDTVMEQKGLLAPDPEVQNAALSMMKEFQAGSLKCLEGNEAETNAHFGTAEKELAKLAVALAPYGMQP